MPTSDLHRSEIARLLLFVAVPLALGVVGRAFGLWSLGSKWLGAVWAFSAIAAFELTRARGWQIALAFLLPIAGKVTFGCV